MSTDFYQVDELLSEEERLTRDSVRSFVDSKILPIIGKHFEEGTFPTELIPEFGKLGVQLEIRATDYNQFQDKVLKGKHQIFWWGWLADYPDAENFLFLLYGPNAKYPNQGENTANYSNPEYDRLYRLMQTMDDSPEKQKVMDQMVAIVREDAPWAWGYWPYVALAFQPWAHNGKPSIVVRDLAKYYRIDPALRVARQAEWNQPVRWPLALIALALIAMVLAAWRGYRARQQATAKPKNAAPVAV